MRQLGIRRAHIVGHSSGGNIALQLALETPEHVQSLALLEPALPTGDGDQRMLSTRQAAMAPVLASWRAGDKAGAVDGFMRMVSGPAYRAAFDRALPGAFEQGVADADTFFTQELPAIQQWRLTREDAGRITQPVLAVIGGRSPEVSPIWPARQQLMLSWLPHAEGFVLPEATHLLHLQDPRAMAEALASFSPAIRSLSGLDPFTARGRSSPPACGCPCCGRDSGGRRSRPRRRSSGRRGTR